MACFVAGLGKVLGTLGLGECIGGMLEVSNFLALRVGDDPDHEHVENL